MANIFCNHCYKTWKLKKEYDKHLACCEFFHCLRQKTDAEMDGYIGKVPSHMELCRLVQDLMNKVDKQEKEITRLKSFVNAKHKKLVTEWLGQPCHLPIQTFEEWWHLICVENEHLMQVFKHDLIDGIKMSINQYLSIYGKNKLPIRAFTQKPGVYYIYTQNTQTSHNEWRIMTNGDMERMLLYLSQAFVREFLKWQKEFGGLDGENETQKEKELNYMIKVNGMRMPAEKRVSEIKKWLFPLLEENIQNVDYE